MASSASPYASHLTHSARDTATMQRSAGRVAAAVPAPSSVPPRPSLSGAPSVSPTRNGSHTESLNTTTAAAALPASSLDTWTSFLSEQWAESIERGKLAVSPPSPPSPCAHSRATGPGGAAAPATPAPSTVSLTSAELMSSLQNVVARQNRVVAQLKERLMQQRAMEAEEWELTRVDATTPNGHDNTGKEETEGRGDAALPHEISLMDTAVENTEVSVLLGHVLENARTRWADAVSAHFQDAEARKPPLRATTANGAAKVSLRGKTDAAARVSAEAAMEEERVGLPSMELLFCSLVEGMNAPETQQTIVSLGLLPSSAWESGVLGVDQLGILTVFQRHVQALRTFPGLVPSLEDLRSFFAELHPSKLTTTHPCGPLDSTLELAEGQLDTFLRVGEGTEQVAALLREGLHPSVRRLVYARALQVPLTVTDGQPLFLPVDGTASNHMSHGLARYVTCASRHARDKVRRRFQHHYSSFQQEQRACLLQRVVLDDMFTAVGDSDKYFVYMDDVEVLATALVVDRSVPDLKMKEALKQLGRRDGALDNYLVFLHFSEADLVARKAPACGFFPLEGFTFLHAPLCNVTGDTMEQYELLSAMMAQLWSRLQGPTPELLQCCLLFEDLVQRLALPAVVHATRHLQYPPLLLALRWMLTGFADLLDSFELLSFWDLMLSYHVREMHRRSPLSAPTGVAGGGASLHRLDTTTTPCALWLLPVYAAAIFVMRAPLVEACRSAAEVNVVFAIGHQLRTRSLLQGLLFG